MSDPAEADGGRAQGFDWVTPLLAVGGSLPADAAPSLERAGMRAVIDLRDEDSDDPRLLADHGIDFLHLPTRDHHAVSQAMLDTGVAFAMERLSRDERVLVHCREGIGRSVTLTLCILAALDPALWGHEPIAAMRLIKDARLYASPSPAQFEAWARWLQRRGMPWPDFDPFAAVAYRHLRAG